MKYQLPCEIVQDLLPSYIDELVNDVTREAVREHLQECKACSELYERMKAPEQKFSDVKDTKEIDFLKKNRVRGRRAVANAIGLGEAIGPYKNELQTSEEPYGWKILMEGSYTEEEADADAILGQSVKSYVETPADLKRLLETVGLSVN